MKCYDCGKAYTKQNGRLSLSNKRIGRYDIYLEEYYKCEGCDSILYPKESVIKIELKEAEICNELIRKLPVDEFIMPIEAANLLGVTKQAFHKNNRIKRGLIYSVVICGRKLYSKKSVALFKEKKDGRFSLVQASSQALIVPKLYTLSESFNVPEYCKSLLNKSEGMNTTSGGTPSTSVYSGFHDDVYTTQSTKTIATL